MVPGKCAIENFKLTTNDFKFLGKNLVRPESMIASADGTLWVCDARGGVTKLSNNEQIAIGYDEHAQPSDTCELSSIPNGLAFYDNSSLLVADLGLGKLDRLNLDGTKETILDSIEGKPLGAVNHVLVDRRKRIWVSVSTTCSNWLDAASPNVSNGYIILIENNQARIVIEQLSFANQIVLDANEEYLYIAETFAQRISRVKLTKNGLSSQKETYGPSNLGMACFPDGITFDVTGNLWGTTVISEQVFAILPNGEHHVVFNDGTEENSRQVENAFQNDQITLELASAFQSKISPGISSVTFGGPKLDTLYLGSLMGNNIPYVKTPFFGLPPTWW